MTLPGPLPSAALPPELFPPESSLPERSFPEVTDAGLHFLLEEARESGVSDAPQKRRGRRRMRRVALSVIAGLALAASGVALTAWELQRQDLAQPLQLPAVAAPAQPVGAGAAPVIPPAELSAPVKP
jgi:hypothetical protein